MGAKNDLYVEAKPGRFGQDHVSAAGPCHISLVRQSFTTFLVLKNKAEGWSLCVCTRRNLLCRRVLQ
eukprot:189758-Amphidinium_carterae.1